MTRVIRAPFVAVPFVYSTAPAPPSKGLTGGFWMKSTMRKFYECIRIVATSCRQTAVTTIHRSSGFDGNIDAHNTLILCLREFIMHLYAVITFGNVKFRIQNQQSK